MWANFLRIAAFSVLGLGLLFGGIFLFSPKVDYQLPDRLKALGEDPFDALAWREAGPEARAKMAFDLVRSRVVTGLDEAGVKAVLGEPTARYLRPENLAYRIGTDFVKSRFGPGFTLAFIRNPKSGKYDSFWIEPFPEEVFAP